MTLGTVYFLMLFTGNFLDDKEKLQSSGLLMIGFICSSFVIGFISVLKNVYHDIVLRCKR